MDTATGNRVDIYLSNMGDADLGARVNGLGGNVWVPALTTSPVLSMRTWNGDFTAAVEPGEARLAFTLGPVKRRVAAVETYYWAGAPIEVYAEEVGTAWPWTARFSGNVRDYAGTKRKWTITAAVDERKFARNVLTASYFGTGGIEGGDSLKGKVKPLVLGWATNVEPVLIDAVNNVYQFSGYGAIEAVTTLYERGSAFPASTGDYANYTALVAASIPNGGWGTCLASGLIRLGAPQFGVITGDVKGHKVGASTPRLPGSVISALATIAGVSSGDLNATSLTAFDTGVPYPINLFIDGQVEFADMAREIALSCNWVAGISLKGKFFAAPVSLTPAAAVTLNAQGAAKPQVLDTNEKSVSLPYWKTVLGAQRVWRVHSADEIAFTEELAVTGYLTKEAASLSATSAGVVSDFSPASGTFKVLQGQIDRTTASTFSLVSATGATATINATTGAYSVSAMSADSATVTFQAVYNGVTLTKVLSLTKAKAGAAGSAGAAAKTLTLISDRQTIYYDAAGSASPSTQTTTFTTNKQNTTATVNWSVTDAAGVARTPVTSYLSAATGNSVTMTEAQFASARNSTSGVIVTATLTDGTTISDKISVVRVQEGAAGTNGLNNATVYLYQRAASSPAAPSGTFTYTFATGVLSGGTPGSWTQAIPAADGNPLWVIAAVASASTATASVTAASFTSPVIDSGAGLNQATVRLYQRSSSAPAVPASTLTYTFSTGALSGTLGSWSTAVPSGSNPLYTTQATALGTGATDTILTGEWSAPVVMAQDGATGATGTAGTSALSIVVTKKSVSLPAYANGDVTDFSPATGQLTVYLGNTDVTASATLSATESGCTGTINTATNTPVAAQPKGYYRVTAMSADTATLTLTAVYSGQTLTEIVSLAKAKGGYEIVATLPTTNLFEGRVVYLSTDDKLYRYTGTEWISAVAAVDITGTITTTQITDDAITSPKIAANAVTATEIAANAVTATAIATDAVTANKIQAGAVTAAKISVTSLDAIAATIGVLRTATSGARSEIRDNVIKVYDSSGVLRVKIGDLSL